MDSRRADLGRLLWFDTISGLNNDNSCEMFSDFAQLLAFVRDRLLDPRAKAEHLRTLIPKSLPSGRPPLVYESEQTSRLAAPGGIASPTNRMS